MNPYLQLAIALEPSIPAIIADVRALFAKHPALADPAAQSALIAAIVGAATTTETSGLAAIAADQADQKADPPPPLPPT